MRSSDAAVGVALGSGGDTVTRVLRDLRITMHYRERHPFSGSVAAAVEPLKQSTYGYLHKCWEIFRISGI